MLLQRILAERRAKWEADELAKLTAKGKRPKDDSWKAKYKEPVAPDTSELGDLPEGWVWATVEQLTLKVGDVDHKMPRAVTEGIPYISTKDFTGQHDIDFTGAKRITRSDFESLSRKIRPEYGDLLLSRYGTVGEVRRVQVDFDFEASYSVAILKTLNSSHLADYLTLALRSADAQEQMRRHIRASSQPDLGLEYIRKIIVCLPPLVEQERIMAEHERIASVTDETEIEIDHSLRRAERLRQSILKRAFEGKLVPQDPNDEPASVLLERVRAERAAAAPNGRETTRRRGVGKPAKARMEPLFDERS